MKYIFSNIYKWQTSCFQILKASTYSAIGCWCILLLWSSSKPHDTNTYKSKIRIMWIVAEKLESEAFPKALVWCCYQTLKWYEIFHLSRDQEKSMTLHLCQCTALVVYQTGCSITVRDGNLEWCQYNNLPGWIWIWGIKSLNGLVTDNFIINSHHIMI